MREGLKRSGLHYRPCQEVVKKLGKLKGIGKVTKPYNSMNFRSGRAQGLKNRGEEPKGKTPAIGSRRGGAKGKLERRRNGDVSAIDKV